ncbi:sensor domain-containing diguanylate cyclase [Acidisoma silvae]|uniref:diguanylate cyclase n=1 Tax=Acidisoma silvae TaxID=2802396 RepID=A0A963YU53_9PROT|nr:sensor domain-containing diguanylate cyclase [Acidisoma silvae]MCB8877123.1 sensor domain-containing diguanylate cyclase [Acidisoma silvae]
MAMQNAEREVTGLGALTSFARMAAGADFALAFQAGADGLAVPLASDPGPLPQPFALGRARLETIDWSDGPRDVSGLAVPSAILLAFDRPAQQVLFVACPFAEEQRSGVLLVWLANGARVCECPFRETIGSSVHLLQAAFGQMMASQHDILDRKLASDRFHDLFETVPTGIVVLDGDTTTALVNQRAAALLDVPAGETDASQVGAQMRGLRDRCHNHDSLAAVYAPLQQDLGYSSTTVWAGPDQHIEVDTHPILGHGRNGRIWLFHDVTARERLEEELRHKADTDVLTGLANRRRFFDVANAAVQRAYAGKGADGRLALLLLDIDHFKSINDQHGHAAGDAVLRDLAPRCQAILRMRSRDMIARIGGEEFAVLLPGASAEEAKTVAERLRAAISAEPTTSGETPISITISLGGAAFQAEDQASPRSLEALLKLADDRLYRAKRDGRDRAVLD